MPLKPLLMGAEVEYSMPSRFPSGNPQRGTSSSRRLARMRLRGSRCHSLLLEAIREEHHWLPDIRSPGGIYIDNGSRYYLDSGNHNEFSSPELSTPRQVAIYDRAAERILLRAKANLLAKSDPIDICITKHNLNFSMPSQASWGQHEAYTCWIELKDAAKQLIPHLVSRVSFAGAGYLSSHAAGMGFELSQRARHMTRAQGMETTHNRAIFCTRAWKPSDVSELGWKRTNLISKDSQRCSFGMYLTYGVTSLLFKVINEGHQLGSTVQLENPVAAMRAFSLDPWLQTTVQLSSGKQATAIDIQRAYLHEVQPFIEGGDYPEWAYEVHQHWAATLEQLESDPMQLSDRLDTYMKLSIFDHQLTRASMTWASLRQALEALDRLRKAAPEVVVSALLNESDENLDTSHSLLFKQLRESAEWKRCDLDELRFAVRLQAVELNYHELGGLFDQLNANGQVNSVVVASEEVQHAIHNPPKGGRAEARSKSIEELHGQPWVCDWQYVVNQTEEKWIDLRDPFTNERKTTSSKGRFLGRKRPSELDDLLTRLVN